MDQAIDCDFPSPCLPPGPFDDILLNEEESYDLTGDIVELPPTPNESYEFDAAASPVHTPANLRYERHQPSPAATIEANSSSLESPLTLDQQYFALPEAEEETTKPSTSTLKSRKRKAPKRFRSESPVKVSNRPRTSLEEDSFPEVNPNQPSTSKRPKLDKSDPSYAQKREKNNIAVKKCRAKTKQKQASISNELEKLQRENEELKALLRERELDLEASKRLYFQLASQGLINPSVLQRYRLN